MLYQDNFLKKDGKKFFLKKEGKNKNKITQKKEWMHILFSLNLMIFTFFIPRLCKYLCKTMKIK